MINVNQVYLNVLDRISKDEGGYMSALQYDRFAWLAQLDLLNWITGGTNPGAAFQPYTSQKNRDWIMPLVKKLPVQVVNGTISKPADYYMYENCYMMGSYVSSDCEEETDPDDCNTPIELLSNSKFYNRCHTFIEGLQPSFLKPVAKMVGNTLEFMPKDLGSIVLEYIRLPVKTKLATILDPVYNDYIYTATGSVDFEWPEYARTYLVDKIADLFFNFTREKSGKEFNMLTEKTDKE